MNSQTALSFSEQAKLAHYRYLDGLRQTVELSIDLLEKHHKEIDGLMTNAPAKFQRIAEKALREFTGRANVNLFDEYRLSENAGKPDYPRIIKALKKHRATLKNVLKAENYKMASTGNLQDGESILATINNFHSTLATINSENSRQREFDQYPVQNEKAREYMNSSINDVLYFGSGSLANLTTIAKQLNFESTHAGFEKVKQALTQEQLDSNFSYPDDFFVYDANTLEERNSSAILTVQKEYVSTQLYQTPPLSPGFDYDTYNGMIRLAKEKLLKATDTFKTFDVYHATPVGMSKIENSEQLREAFDKVIERAERIQSSASLWSKMA